MSRLEDMLAVKRACDKVRVGYPPPVSQYFWDLGVHPGECDTAIMYHLFEDKFGELEKLTNELLEFHSIELSRDPESGCLYFVVNVKASGTPNQLGKLRIKWHERTALVLGHNIYPRLFINTTRHHDWR